MRNSSDRAWFWERLVPGHPMHVHAAAVRLRGPLDTNRLRAVVPEGTILDVRPAAADLDSDQVAELARAPFDLAGSLWRISLLRTAEQDHVLVVAAHRMAAEETAVYRVLAELGRGYAGLPVPAAAVLPQQENVESDLDYWQHQLDGATALELPTDHPRPAVPGFRYSTVDCQLADGALHGGEVPAVVRLLAGCRALIAAYTQHRDVLIGTSVRGRPVALRTELADDPTFTELLDRVHRTYRAAHEHAGAPIETVVARLRPARTPGRDPLFGLTVQVAEPAPGLDFGELTTELLDVGHSHVPVDVDITARGTVLTATYDAEQFDHDRMQAMLTHLARILTAALAHPTARLSELPLLDSTETEIANHHAHGAALSYPDKPVHRLVAEQAARTPDAPAVSAGERTLSYAELDEAAAHIAGHLVARGVGPGALVAVLLDRDVDLIATLLGILRTGAGYVPLDSRNPPGRLATIIEVARCRLAVTTERLRTRLPPELTVVRLDRDQAVIAAAGSAPDAPDDPDALCHVVFTSGSTGTPKGVAASHRNVVSFTTALAALLGAEQFRRTLCSTPLSFDACLVELWSPLCTGGTLVVADNLLFAADELDGITLANAVPSVLTEFLRIGRFPDSMRTLTIGAEPLSPALVRQVFDACQVDRIYNIYGPTETTAYITAKQLERGDNGPITIGTPIPNATAFVLDRYGRPAPVGIPGELSLGGPGVALGYLHRPELTAQVFHHTAGRRTYRTGDLVVRLANGELDYRRRLDNQVKVRGFRIELGEIESCLARHDSVHAAAAAVRVDPAGEPRLVGYLAAEPAPDLVAELTRQCQRDLPAYMVPDAFVVLPAIPRTVTGKADRRGLPDPAWSHPAAPMAELLRRELVTLWAGLLGSEPAGAQDNFFTLGGDSLTAVRMIDQCNARFGIALPALTAFLAPTLAALGAEIERAVLTEVEPVEAASPDRTLADALAVLRARGTATAGALPRRSPTEPLRASIEQQQRWLADRLAVAGGALQHIAVAVRLPGPLLLDTLTGSLTAVLTRHETLRTTFHPTDSGVRLLVAEKLEIPVAVHQLADRLDEAMAAELRRPFDLAVGPPLRCRLWRLPDDTHLLMLTAHRIACDERSLEIVVAELTDGVPTEPAPDYPDFAAQQWQALDTGALDADIEYWQRQLDGATTLELATDRPRPVVPTLASRQVVEPLDPAMPERLRILAKNLDTTTNAVLLAGVHAVLARYTRQDDILIGTAVDGRDLPECRGMVGPFADILPLRTDVAGDPSFAELTDRVDRSLRGLAAHRRVPFATLVDRLAPARDTSRQPYFQLVVKTTEDPVDPQRVAVPAEQLRHDLAITVNLADADTAVLVADYASDLFDAWRIEALLRHLRNVLDAVADDPAIALSALPMLDAAELREVFEFGRGPVRSYHRGPIHQLVFDQVRQHPDTPAAVFDGAELSYRELGRKAGVLARRLRELGLGSDDLVGVALPRGLDAPPTVIGVLASGAAIVPVDPTHPRERVGFMFADSEMKALVTRSEVLHLLPAPADWPVILLDQLWADPQADGPLPVELATQDSAVCLLYTSGSTGRPKGVLLEHHAMACYADFNAEVFDIGVGARVLQFSSLIFDFGVGELLTTLAHGGTVVSVPQPETIDPIALAALLHRDRVSRIAMTPAVLARLPLQDYPDLTHVMVGGERCGAELVNDWNAPGRRFINLYGPTEIAVGCTYEICAHQQWRRPPPIGAAMPNRRIYLVDRYGNPTPRGVPGELLAAGDGLALGYHRRPELTARKFVADPFQPHGRAYHTGDLAAWNETGRLLFVGRIDTQVKLWGQRIELGEIETLLGNHPAIRKAVVMLRADTPSGDGLVAYFVCHDPTDPPAPATLREYLAGFLPAVMVPASYCVLPTFPLGPTGKLLREQLPPAPPESFATSTFIAPRTDTEHQVAAVYAEVLGRPKVGATDDFFALGGSSLQVVLVLNRIGDRFGVQVPTQLFYTDPAVASVARTIEDTVLELASDDELAALLAQTRPEEESDRDRVDP